MSSYSSLSRILSPFRIQTRFEENSLPNRYMAEITLFCYVLGTHVNSAIPVDIGNITKVDGPDVTLKRLNFGHIKKLIWPNNNKANELKLMKFVTPLKEDNEALKELNKKFYENIELSDELSPGTKFLKEFPVGYGFLDDYIHIIVQPPPPATTDQGHTDASHDIANLGYLPRQGGLGGTLLPISTKVRSSNEGVNVNDPDISLRFDITPSLIKDLENKNVILVRAPPFSGKTSMAQILEYNLVNAPEFSNRRIIRVSMMWKQSVGVENCFDSFNVLWHRIVGIDWTDWLGQCRFIPSILIIDEAQLIYGKEKKVYQNNTESADQFWMTVKGALQEMANIKIIMFAAYGYKSSNHTGLITPVALPESHCKSLIDINFTPKELETYVMRFSSSYFKNLNQQSILRFYRYIKVVTGGHAGLVRHILMSTEEAMRKRIDNNDLTWNDIFKYLNSGSFNSSIYANCRAVPKVSALSIEQIKICEDIFLKGEIRYIDSDDDMADLVKTGILIIKDDNLTFAAPLLKRSFFQQNYGAQNIADSTPTDLHHFIVKIFTIMCDKLSKKILRETLGIGSEGILEQTWQKEFYRIGTQVLGRDHFLSCEVGSVFGCEGKVDFYVDKLDWAIELLRDGEDMAKHKLRFEPLVGKYKEIVEYAKSIAIIDTRSEAKKVRKMKEDFIYVSCSKDFDAFKIESLDKETVTIRFQN